MPFIIKACRTFQKPIYLASSQNHCCLGLDGKGLLTFEQPYLVLFDLEKYNSGLFHLTVKSRELHNLKETLLDSGSTISVGNQIELNWRDYNLKVVQISDAAQYLARLAQPVLLERTPTYWLKSFSHKIDLPLFTDQEVTIGSNSKDSIQIFHPMVKSAHLKICINSNGSCKAEGFLGKIEKSADGSSIKLLPSLVELSLEKFNF